MCFAACSSSDADSSDAAGATGDAAAGANSAAGARADAGSSSDVADTAGAAASSDQGGARGVDADNAGTDNGGSSAGDSSSGGSSAGSSSAGGTGDAPPGVSLCQYSVSGGATETSPSSASVCSQSKLTTAYAGGFTVTIGGGFQDADGNILALACTIDSPTAPAAGDSWKLTTAAESQGNCLFNRVSNAQVASSWSASANDTTVIGAATVKFKSVTLTHGTYKPSDVYYFFDATIDATIPAQSADVSEITVSGRFQVQTLPIGS